MSGYEQFGHFDVLRRAFDGRAVAGGELSDDLKKQSTLGEHV